MIARFLQFNHYWLSTVLVLSLCILSLSFFALSFVGYEFLKHQADIYSTRGQATIITPIFYAQFVPRLRIFALISLICTIPIYLARKTLVNVVQSLSQSFNLLWTQAWDEVKGIRDEPLSVQLALVFIILCGVLLRLNFIQEPLGFDESWTFLSFVQMPAFIYP